MAQSEIQQSIQRARAAIEAWQREGPAGTAGPVGENLEQVRHLLGEIDREILQYGPPIALAHQFRHAVDKLRESVRDLLPELPDRAKELFVSLRQIESRLFPSLEIESVPLLGVLPLARWIPTDVHSVMDYTNGLMTASAAWFAQSYEARFASVVLGASIVSISSMTDYRLSLANVIPIEVHEALDYVWGAACIAMPFVLGYYEKNPITSFIHIVTGVTTILASLFTDYRAAKGRGHSPWAAAAMMGAKLQPGVSTHLEYSR